MPYFCGHTHTKHARRGSDLADRSGFLERGNVFEGEPGVRATNAGKSAATQSAIRELAYSYWEARGYRGGSEWEDWFRAERELQQRSEP
jgi:hypothetical protein